MKRCATTSRELAEPLAGTAAVARTWLLIEQPGPWGVKGLTQSRFDPVLGRELERAADPAGVRVALIRRPGRHADRHRAIERRVFVAHTLPGGAWVRTAVLDRPEELRDLDIQRLGAGLHDGFGERYDGDPLALVCTNGKRDRCCALLGRPLAAELTLSGGAGVWEITHIGGHRFSPTLLTLPHGYAYGRVSAPAVKHVLAELHDGRIVTEGCRGRSSWDRPGQAAELAVRTLTGETGADALTVHTTELPSGGAGTGAPPTGTDGWRSVVGHADGRRWQVRVAAGVTLPPSPASCGAAVLPQSRMDIAGITPLAAG